MDEIESVNGYWRSIVREVCKDECHKNLSRRIRALNIHFFQDDNCFECLEQEKTGKRSFKKHTCLSGWEIISKNKGVDTDLCLCGHPIQDLCKIKRGDEICQIGSKCIERFDETKMSEFSRKTYECDRCSNKRVKKGTKCKCSWELCYDCGNYCLKSERCVCLNVCCRFCKQEIPKWDKCFCKYDKCNVCGTYIDKGGFCKSCFEKCCDCGKINHINSLCSCKKTTCAVCSFEEPNEKFAVLLLKVCDDCNKIKKGKYCGKRWTDIFYDNEPYLRTLLQYKIVDRDVKDCINHLLKLKPKLRVIKK